MFGSTSQNTKIVTKLIRNSPIPDTSAPAFGSTSAPAFGTSSIPSFGVATTPSFGASSPSFSFGSTPAFGQSTSAFGSTPFGASPSPFGAQSSAFGAQTTAPAFRSPGFGSSTFGGQRGGSRVAAYTPTAEEDGDSVTQPAGKLESISAMQVYKDKSHEELRWEDYQLGDKGVPNSAVQPAGAAGFGANTQSNPFSSSSTFGQTSANPFSSTPATNPFGQKSAPFSNPGFAASTSAFGSSAFGSSTNANPFGSTSSAAPSLFGSTTSTFGGNSASPIGSTPASSAFGNSTFIFGSASAQGTTSTPFNSGLNFGNTQQSPLFQSTTPAIGQSSSAFGQAPSFGQTAPGFGQTNMFNNPSTGFGGNMFSSTPSLLTTSSPMGFGQTMPSQSAPFELTQPSQNAGAFGNFGHTQAVNFSLRFGDEEVPPYKSCLRVNSHQNSQH